MMIESKRIGIQAIEKLHSEKEIDAFKMIQSSKKINVISFFSFHIEAEHEKIFMLINVNKEVVENDLKHNAEM